MILLWIVISLLILSIGWIVWDGIKLYNLAETFYNAEDDDDE